RAHDGGPRVEDPLIAAAIVAHPAGRVGGIGPQRPSMEPWHVVECPPRQRTGTAGSVRKLPFLRGLALALIAAEKSAAAAPGIAAEGDPELPPESAEICLVCAQDRATGNWRRASRHHEQSWGRDRARRDVHVPMRGAPRAPRAAVRRAIEGGPHRPRSPPPCRP